jgi:hypothetical protein
VSKFSSLLPELPKEDRELLCPEREAMTRRERLSLLLYAMRMRSREIGMLMAEGEQVLSFMRDARNVVKLISRAQFSWRNLTTV